MAIDTSLPVSNKGPNGSPITDSNGNPIEGVEVALRRLILNDTNSDGEGDEITDSILIARTQTDSNGEYQFTSNDLPPTYPKGASEEIHYCAVRADYLEPGSGDALDNGRFYTWSPPEGYIIAYSLERSYLSEIIHAWRFDEGSGSTATDSVGIADATLQGDTSFMWVSDKQYVGDYAIQGDGANDYVDVGTLGTFGGNLDTNWTLLLTFKTTDGGSQKSLMGEIHGVAPQIFDPLRVNTDGSLEMLIRDGADNDINVRTSSTGYNDGNPHRVAVRRDTSVGSGADSIDYFVDGAKLSTLISKDQNVSSFSNFVNPLTYLARNNRGSPEWYVDATIDFPKIADDALTDSEIQSDYNDQPWS